MTRLFSLALLGAMFILAGGLAGQVAKKDDPKKDDPPAKIKGKLPSHWGKIGLTDTQKQTVYQIQAKYDPDIDKLEAKIAELKGTRDKEMKAVLTADQKKALEAAILGKDKEKEK
jgi:Spy/CpxP family protein refolding chaperone